MYSKTSPFLFSQIVYFKCELSSALSACSDEYDDLPQHVYFFFLPLSRRVDILCSVGRYKGQLRDVSFARRPGAYEVRGDNTVNVLWDLTFKMSQI